MLMNMLLKYGSDTDESDDDYLYKEGWVAGPNTTLEGLPQAQPYGYDAALIPGFIRKVYKIKKSGLKKKQAQLAKFDRDIMLAFTKKKWIHITYYQAAQFVTCM